MTARVVAAVDLGAESGRVAAVSFDGGALRVREVNRFGHQPFVRRGLLRWDVPAMWRSIRDGLSALASGAPAVASVGVDAWGVDYGLYGAGNQLLDDPVSYRDGRTVAAMREALTVVDAGHIFDRTGVQPMPINTIFALFADAHGSVPRLPGAERLLMMPDVFHQLLAGSAVSEYTAVSTSGAYDLARGSWATDVLDALGIPTDLLPPVVPPGTDLGPLRGRIAHGALAGARVVVPAAHDTASAVAAVPFVDPDAMFISSGTWSLGGVEVPRPVVTPGARRANLTNEGGYADTICFLRNMTGLWILQQCRRQWAADGCVLDYREIAELADAEPHFAAIIDPDADEFAAPGDMPRRIREYCRRHGQPVPETVGQVARCVVTSLAVGYRAIAEALAGVTGARPPSISVVGGGADHSLLCQLTADVTGLPVYAGPAEATALGNGAVQLAALGELSGPQEIRSAVAAGYPPRCYEPRGTAGNWDQALVTLQDLATRRRATSGP